MGSLIQAKERCELSIGVDGCDKFGAVWYPKCKEGFELKGCCSCVKGLDSD